MSYAEKMLHILLPVEMIKKLDNFRFDQRFESRAAAVRYLLDYALEQNPQREIKE